MAEVAECKTSIATLEIEQKQASAELDKALAEIPNLPANDVPDGPDETANVRAHHFGAKRNYAFDRSSISNWRSAWPDGFRDGGKAVGRAVCGLKAASRGWNVRSVSSCSMCIRASMGTRK